jgi:hypothetical protein
LDDFGRQQDWQKNRRPKNETGIETGINFERPAFAYFLALIIFLPILIVNAPDGRTSSLARHQAALIATVVTA